MPNFIKHDPKLRPTERIEYIDIQEQENITVLDSTVRIE